MSFHLTLCTALRCTEELNYKNCSEGNTGFKIPAGVKVVVGPWAVLPLVVQGCKGMLADLLQCNQVVDITSKLILEPSSMAEVTSKDSPL